MMVDRAHRPCITGFAPSEISSLVNLRVVEEHASEAAFLWKQRERAVLAPHYKLDHLAKLDARVLAHLRGLQVAGEIGVNAAARQLGEADASAVFVAAYLVYSSRDAGRMSQLLQLALTDVRFEAALRAALAWLDASVLESVLDRLSASASARCRTIALAVRSAQRIAPDVSAAFVPGEPDAELRARMLRSIGETGQSGHRSIVEHALRDPDTACRFWAGWSLALLGDPAGARVAFDAAAAVPQLDGHGLQIAMRCGDMTWARDTVRSLVGAPEQRRRAIRAVGAFGDPAAVPWLIDQIEDARYARVAGEAISTLTGADLTYLDLDRDPPDDTGETLPEDEDLPWPDADALHRWWAQERGRFVSGQRYLGGEPVGAGGALRVLRAGYQRQRMAAAIEFARARPGAMVFPVRARADWQQHRLAA